MDNERSAEHRCERAEPPAEVRIVVLRDPDDRGFRERLQDRHGIRVLTRGLVPIVLLLVGMVAAAIVVFGGGKSALQGVDARARASGPVGVAAAYGYPSRCVSVTISSIDPAFARADFDHATACGDYTGYVTAIFRRVNRVWRPVLEAVAYLCPVPAIPAAVQRELGVCT